MRTNSALENKIVYLFCFSDNLSPVVESIIVLKRNSKHGIKIKTYIAYFSIVFKLKRNRLHVRFT